MLSHRGAQSLLQPQSWLQIPTQAPPAAPRAFPSSGAALPIAGGFPSSPYLVCPLRAESSCRSPRSPGGTCLSPEAGEAAPVPQHRPLSERGAERVLLSDKQASVSLFQPRRIRGDIGQPDDDDSAPLTHCVRLLSASFLLTGERNGKGAGGSAGKPGFSSLAPLAGWRSAEAAGCERGCTDCGGWGAAAGDLVLLFGKLSVCCFEAEGDTQVVPLQPWFPTGTCVSA